MVIADDFRNRTWVPWRRVAAGRGDLRTSAAAAERDEFIVGARDYRAMLATIGGRLNGRELREASIMTEDDVPLSPEIERELARLKPEEAGGTIGPYKLREQLGEGGFGTVWVAEQEAPVKRRVALKILKLGMDTREVIARFEQERQALAMMDHPGIAKVLDAGATQFGRPFFVMELVRGISITEYCDQNNLPTLERLGLYLAVCKAVQYAHQKGIIHRDLKPSNILVTLHDGAPVPKVIDFGIAKATEGRLTDATVYTQLHQFVGTPAYMSPEQAEMGGLDIDTRSDIYSLGVLLYELLTGCTPFEATELMSQGIDGMRRTIREKEPARPSTRLASLEADELTTAAKRRSVECGKLLHQLRGDLDWIVMKCLEKDRTRRYETANGLAADLQRHLDNEPVVARPPSAAYRLQKAFRRHKVAFAAAAAVFLAMTVGISVSVWQAVRAKRAEALTQQSRNDAEKLSIFMLDDFYAELEPIGRFETLARLVGRVLSYYDGLPPSLRTKDTERNRFRAQARLALVTASVGDIPKAAPLADQAVAALEAMRHQGDESEETAFALALAIRAEFLCKALLLDMRVQAAPLLRAVEVLRPFVASNQASRRVKLEYATLLNYLTFRQSYEQGILHSEAALSILARMGALDLSDLDASSAWASTANAQGVAFFGLNRIEEAERMLQKAVQIAERVLERRPGDVGVKTVPADCASIMGMVAAVRFDDAAALGWFHKSRKALEDYLRFNPSDKYAWNTLTWQDHNRAALLFRSGNVADALELAHAAARVDQEHGNAGWNGEGPWTAIARWEGQRGNRAAAAEARREWNRAIEVFAERTHMSKVVLGYFGETLRHDEREEMLMHGEAAAVVELARKSLARLEEGSKEQDHPELSAMFKVGRRQALADLTIAALKLGRFAEAETTARALNEITLTCTLWAEWMLLTHPDDMGWGHVLLAQAQVAQGRAAEALRTLEPALAMYRAMKARGADHLVFRQHFARAHYVQALAQPTDASGAAQRGKSLAEAAKLLGELSEGARQLHCTKELLGWIEAAGQ